MWIGIIIVKSPKCTDFGTLFEMSAFVVMSNILLGGYFFMVCYHSSRRMIGLVTRTGLSEELNDEIYGTQIRDPNFDLQSYILREQNF